MRTIKAVMMPQIFKKIITKKKKIKIKIKYHRQPNKVKFNKTVLTLSASVQSFINRGIFSEQKRLTSLIP